MAKDMQDCPARSLAQQQIIADGWREDFNCIRPHDSLKDKTPSQVYTRSKRKYRLAEPALEYPSQMHPRFVNRQGQFKWNGKRYFLSKALGAENIGLEFTKDGSVDIWFGNALLARSDANFSQPLIEYDLITGDISGIKHSA
ncbi:MAG: integrase core domain-containing protein [Deltaproteobacteria bacterium]|nr:integrase core domain-containing protein [Deltaproteobacteria bacterium]